MNLRSLLPRSPLFQPYRVNSDALPAKRLEAAVHPLDGPVSPDAHELKAAERAALPDELRARLDAAARLGASELKKVSTEPTQVRTFAVGAPTLEGYVVWSSSQSPRGNRRSGTTVALTPLGQVWTVAKGAR